MAHASADVAPAAVFLVLYLTLFALLTTLYSRKAIAWKSRYTFLLFHVVLRLAGMVCGVAFSVLEWSPGGGTRVDVLVAYLVLSAEGYFSLIVCAFRFLVVWQQDRLGASWLEPRIPQSVPRRTRLRAHLRAPLAALHWALIVANALIVAGSSVLAGTIGKEENADLEAREQRGKALRTAGTAVFLAIVQAFLLLCFQSLRRRGDRTLALITLTWPFLTVRGVYGIVAVVLPAFSYSSGEAYTSTGFTARFLAGEYIMGTAMEWLACSLLLATHFSHVNGGAELVEDWGGEDKPADERGMQLREKRSEGTV